jgi:hypothetical protein
MTIQVTRETHETPQSVVDRVTLAGGLNRFSKPNYRVVWGWNRLDFIGGKWEDRDEHGTLIREVVEVRTEPKYQELNRWHVEAWLPPEAYGSPEVWAMQTVETVNGKEVETLGPYPHMGDYESCFVIQKVNGDFLPLTPRVVEGVVERINASRRAPVAKSKRALYEREERIDKEYLEWGYSVLDDACPAFGGVPQVAVL